MDHPIDDIFKALADSGRRRLLDSLNAHNGQNLSDLCAVMDMTRQSVTRHLEILEAANLVVVVRRGRERLHYLNAAPIHQVADRWIGQYHQERVRALADLKDALELTYMTTITDATTQTRSFVYTTYIKTTPEQLWDALTNPAFAKRYWDMEFITDWKPGSHMTWKHKDVVLDDPAQVVVEAEPFTRLSYTWHTMTPEFAEHIELTAQAFVAAGIAVVPMHGLTLATIPPGITVRPLAEQPAGSRTIEALAPAATRTAIVDELLERLAGAASAYAVKASVRTSRRRAPRNPKTA